MIIIQMTAIRNNAQANKSFAKHSPKTKYAMLNTAKSKSDIFVLWECSRIVNFIFSKYNIQL